MSSDANELLGRLGRFFGGSRQERGGFVGPQDIPPPTPDQFPKVVAVDGVTVEPVAGPVEDVAPSTDADQTSDAAKTSED